MDKPVAETLFDHIPVAVGVDIGGTQLKMGLVSEDGKIFEFQSCSLIRDRAGQADIVSICQTVETFIQEHSWKYSLIGVGIACPGILDTANGVVIYAVNLAWENVRLVDIMTRFFQLNCCLISDAAANTIGECHRIDPDISDFMMICIGTGLGAGLIKNRKLVQLSPGGVINLGHMSVEPNGKACKCGNRGCLERYVSAAAITEEIRMTLKENQRLCSYIGKNEEEQYPRLLSEAAKNGDNYAKSVFQEAGRWLGIAMVNSRQLFGIDTFIIGGGVSQAGEFLLASARQEALRRGNGASLHIKQSALPREAGVMGAAQEMFIESVQKVQ